MCESSLWGMCDLVTHVSTRGPGLMWWCKFLQNEATEGCWIVLQALQLFGRVKEQSDFECLIL